MSLITDLLSIVDTLLEFIIIEKNFNYSFYERFYYVHSDVKFSLFFNIFL